MKKITSLLVVLVAGLVSSHAATTIMLADFETTSGYPTGGNAVTFVGTDGWIRAGGSGVDKARITPDPLASGYTYKLSGNQSAFVSDIWVLQSFSSQNVTTSDIANGEISWLQGTPGTMTANAYTGAFIGDTGGSTPAGIYGMNVGGNYSIYLYGKNGATDTGVTYQYGGGGTPTLSYIYQFSMTFDFSAHTMTGYYNLNGGGKTSLGTVDINSSLTASDFATSYGVMVNAAGSTGFDNFQMDVVPETTTFGMLLLGGVLLLARRKHQV